MMTTDHVELQSALLQCAGNMGGDDGPCQRVSAWVVHAIRPAEAGRRTDMTLFGVCDGHKQDWRTLVTVAGFREGVLVEWEGLGDLLDELRLAGWVA